MAVSPAAILARLRRPGGGRARVSPAERALADRTTADAIDRAVRLERWTHAERLARAATEIEPKSPRLVERLARVRLARGNPQAALELIEDARLGNPLPPAVRLLRAACLVHLGQRDLAARDLRHWLREKTAPLDAGVVLALLDWHAGDDHAATLTLLRNVRWLEHAASLELLLLIAVSGGRNEPAAAWARRLANADRTAFCTPNGELVPDSLDVPSPPREIRVDPEAVETLARELRTHEGVIPALVEAQRRRPEPETAALIAAAMATTLDDLADPSPAIEALATLAAGRGRADEARRWIHEGLRRNPRSHALARLDRALETGAGAAEDVIATIGPAGAGPPTPEEQAA